MMSTTLAQLSVIGTFAYFMTADPAQDAFNIFLERGVTGAIAVIALLVAAYKDRQVAKLYETLINEMRQVAQSHRDVAAELEGIIRRLEDRLSRRRDE